MKLSSLNKFILKHPEIHPETFSAYLGCVAFDGYMTHGIPLEDAEDLILEGKLSWEGLIQAYEQYKQAYDQQTKDITNK